MLKVYRLHHGIYANKHLWSGVEGRIIVQRQCAWCLRLMNTTGERITSLPVPKIYEASHGMCRVCGILWLEQVLQDTEKQAAVQPLPVETDIDC